MPTSAKAPNSQYSPPRWANRILIAGIGGILFLTLYPFRFVSHARLPAGASPFLLSGMGKDTGPLDAFLNVLLFIPLGFGLSEFLRERGKRRGLVFAATLISGALLSYAIEFTQNYIPGRDAGWEDIITNTSGSVAGFLLFEFLGKWVLEFLSIVEGTLDIVLTWRRAGSIIMLYVGFWLIVGSHLQALTTLSNWDHNSSLLVGNDATGRPSTGWQGTISSLQLWNHSLPDSLAIALTSENAPDNSPPGILAAYDFSGSAPFQDRKAFLPNLSWTPHAPSQADPNEPFDGSAWLTSGVPASSLISAIERTNQFAVHVVCRPAVDEGANTTLVSVSNPSGLIDLAIRQNDANLVFWFRNPLSVRHASLAWSTPDILEAGRPRDILYSYDGANLSLYIDGRRDPRLYQLGPGTALAHLFHRVKTLELDGYVDAFYALVFFPAGIILGVATRHLATRDVPGWFFLLLALFAPPWILEAILATVSGRPYSVGYGALSLIFLAAGAIWMNLDDPPRALEA